MKKDKRVITQKSNSANYPTKSRMRGITTWVRESTGNHEIFLNLIILPMVYTHTKIRQRKWDSLKSLRFLEWDGSLSRGQTTSQELINRKKGTCCLVIFLPRADCKMKIKDRNITKYLDLVRELIKLRNMSMMVIRMVNGGFSKSSHT